MTDEAPPVLDPAQVADLLSLDQGKGALFAQFVKVFIDGTPARIEKLKLDAASRDYAALGVEAHALRGAAGNVGAARFSLLLERLETAAKAGDTTAIADAGGLLGSCYETAREALVAATR